MDVLVHILSAAVGRVLERNIALDAALRLLLLGLRDLRILLAHIGRPLGLIGRVADGHADPDLDVMSVFMMQGSSSVESVYIPESRGVCSSYRPDHHQRPFGQAQTEPGEYYHRT